MKQKSWLLFTLLLIGALLTTMCAPAPAPAAEPAAPAEEAAPAGRGCG